MPPEPGVIPDTNFDTLWSMVMTLEPTVQKKKEIWFVQDASESRTSTIINLLERDTEDLGTDYDGREDLRDLFKLLAWAGGLWFFIVHMVMQPIIRLLVHRKLPVHYHNAGYDIFFGSKPSSLEGPAAAVLDKH